MKPLFFLLAVFFSSFSYAQDWNLGVKGGINVASASIKNSPADLSSTLGFHLGGYAATQVTDQISIQPEVLFSLQGWENLNETRTLTYLTVPVAVKYYLVEQFNVHAGPQIGFLISADEEIKDILTSTEFSALIGAEYQINEQIAAGLRFNLGISDIIDDPESNFKLRSRVFQISCSYKLSR